MNDNQAIKIIKEVACGEGCKLSICNDSCLHGKRECTFGRAVKALEEIQEYRKIGTPEECRAAVEKQTAKLVIDNTPTEDSVWYQCPTCKGDLTTIRGFYCQYCGQKLHWR